MPNKMIVIDGVDGAGKGVQSRLLLDAMLRKKLPTILTREPGGSEAAEEIRNLLVTGDRDKWDSMTELLLMYAARKTHLRDTIFPALKSGKWVISDRFADSSRAFQGIAGQLGLDCVEKVHKIVLDDFQPDLVLILDLPETIALERTRNRGGNEDRFESKGDVYYKNVRAAYRQIAQSNDKLYSIINADNPIGIVHKNIIDAVNIEFDLCLDYSEDTNV